MSLFEIPLIAPLYELSSRRGKLTTGKKIMTQADVSGASPLLDGVKMKSDVDQFVIFNL